MILRLLKQAEQAAKSSVRTIYKAKVEKQGERIIIELTGNGFLYNMVRIIAGTLVEVGLRKNKARRNFRNYRKKRKSKRRKNTATTRFIFS